MGTWPEGRCVASDKLRLSGVGGGSLSHFALPRFLPDNPAA